MFDKSFFFTLMKAAKANATKIGAMCTQRNFARLLSLVFACAPVFAMADWSSTLQEQGRAIRIGLYALAGTIALCCLIWSGAKWMISRSNGDHSHTFMDYLQQAGVTLVVGGTVALGTAMWQIFGTGSPE